MVAQLEKEEYTVSSLCNVWGLCRSAYDAWRTDSCGPRRRQDLELKPMIQEIFWDHERRSGARRIVGWDMQDHMRESLVLQGLRSAIADRQPAPELIHHTDRGGPYAGYDQFQVPVPLLCSLAVRSAEWKEGERCLVSTSTCFAKKSAWKTY